MLKPVPMRFKFFVGLEEKTLSPPGCGLSRKEGAGPAEANALAKGADGVKGLAARLRNNPPSLVARCLSLKRKERGLPGLLLGPAARSFLSLRRVVSAFYDISSEALACETFYVKP